MGINDVVTEFELDVLHLAKRAVEDNRVADLGSHGVANALLLASLGNVCVVLVADEDPNTCARLRLLADDPLQAGILSQEKAGVNEYSDLLVTGLEESPPCIPRW